MESIRNREPARDALRVQANREELVERIASVLPNDGKIEPLQGLYLAHISSPAEGLYASVEPSFCVIAQGRKEIHLGEQIFQYDPYQYLLITAQLPLVAHVLEASRDRPYLSLRLTLDSALVSSVMVEAGHAAPGRGVKAIDVNPLSANLLDAVVRLVRLLDNPSEAPVLFSLIKREIVFRLLSGEQGPRLRHVALLNGHHHRIAHAIKSLHDGYTQSVAIERLADEVGMSPSSFHHHFKVVTGMSPLKFQKQLQLQEARRLMLSEDLDAATAGYRVGYNDASHFNREYKQLFGRPPVRDVELLREAARERTA